MAEIIAGEEAIMKTMDELVLDRLIEEAARPIKTDLEETRRELAFAQASLRDRNAAIQRETEWRQKLQKDAQEADVPLTDFFLAAEKVRQAAKLVRAIRKPDQELLATIDRMKDAMKIAEKYVDLVPF